MKSLYLFIAVFTAAVGLVNAEIVNYSADQFLSGTPQSGPLPGGGPVMTMQIQDIAGGVQLTATSENLTSNSANISEIDFLSIPFPGVPSFQNISGPQAQDFFAVRSGDIWQLLFKPGFSNGLTSVVDLFGVSAADFISSPFGAGNIYARVLSQITRTSGSVYEVNSYTVTSAPEVPTYLLLGSFLALVGLLYRGRTSAEFNQ